MARTGCASGAAISACATARNRRRARQVLAAYGLPSLPPNHYPGFTKVLLRTIPGGHFNMAENRTFLLCVDTRIRPRPRRRLRRAGRRAILREGANPSSHGASEKEE